MMNKLEPTVESLISNMKTAISQTDDLEIQATMCSSIALEYVNIMVDKHLK